MRPDSLRVVPDHAPGPHPTASNDLWWWWTPTLGPTASILAYTFATAAEVAGELDWDIATLAVRVGLAEAHGRLWHSIDRLAKFHVMQFASTDVATVRMYLPALPHRQRLRLPEAMQLEYETVLPTEMSRTV